MGNTDAAAKLKKPRVRTHMRRVFSVDDIRLLLAGEYHVFRKKAGVSMRTAHRYGHLARNGNLHGLEVEH